MTAANTQAIHDAIVQLQALLAIAGASVAVGIVCAWRAWRRYRNR